MTPTDAHRKVYDLLVNKHARTGLSREELAEQSGLSDRAMRRVLEELRVIAATKIHPRLGRPVVIGFDPQAERYVAAQDAAQARRVMAYYAARLRPMADSLQAQAAAAKHLQAVDDTTQDALFKAQKALDTRPWS